MDREQITPDSTEHWLSLRKGDITSTQMAALMGVSPYMKSEDVFRAKRTGETGRVFQGEWLEWGNRLEPIIAEEAGVRMQTAVEPYKDYIRIPDERIGSSFDYITADQSVIIECKNVSDSSYKRYWKNDQVPAHILVQVQHQMLVSGVTECVTAVLIGGRKLKLFPLKYNEAMGDTFLDIARKFWKEIDNGRI